MNTLVALLLISIAEIKGIDIDDTIEVIWYAIDNNLDPIVEFRKAFYKT